MGGRGRILCLKYKGLPSAQLNIPFCHEGVLYWGSWSKSSIPRCIDKVMLRPNAHLEVYCDKSVQDLPLLSTNLPSLFGSSLFIPSEPVLHCGLQDCLLASKTTLGFGKCFDQGPLLMRIPWSLNTEKYWKAMRHLTSLSFGSKLLWPGPLTSDHVVRAPFCKCKSVPSAFALRWK